MRPTSWAVTDLTGADVETVKGPFGHQWIAGTPVGMTDAQVQAALDEWAAQA